MDLGNLVFQAEIHGVEVWINHEANHELDVVAGGGAAIRAMLPEVGNASVVTERAVAVLGISLVTTAPTDEVNFVVLHEIGHILSGHIAEGYRLISERDEPAADAVAMSLGASPEAGIDFLKKAYQTFKTTEKSLLRRMWVWCMTEIRVHKLAKLIN
jgi:hypothetical protein